VLDAAKGDGVSVIVSRKGSDGHDQSISCPVPSARQCSSWSGASDGGDTTRSYWSRATIKTGGAPMCHEAAQS